MAKKTLKELLYSNSLEFLMEAHNGISAKIVEEAGFHAIWASSLGISASFGLRDCNEASWSQVIQTIEYMSDSVNIPILMDGDNGYGNYNNVRILVKKLNKLGVEGLCIEDQQFPKKNSLLEGANHKLEDINSFCDKIKIAKDTQSNDNFCVIASLEGFIIQDEIDKVIHRAFKYAAAGADAIIVHSKLTTPSEIIKFMQKWDCSIPVVIIPTTYINNSNMDLFKKLKISAIIWANYNIRASIHNMRNISKYIFEHQKYDPNTISSLEDIFHLTNSSYAEQLVNFLYL